MATINIPHFIFGTEEVTATVFWVFLLLLSLVFLCLLSWKEPSFLRRKDRKTHIFMSILGAFILMYIVPITSILEIMFLIATSNILFTIIFFLIVVAIFSALVAKATLLLQLLPGTHVPKPHELEKARADFFHEIGFESSVFRTRAHHVTEQHHNLFKKEKQLPEVIKTFFESETKKIKELSFGNSAIEAIHALGTILAPIPRKKEGIEYYNTKEGKSLIAASKAKIGSLKLHLKKKFVEEKLIEDILKEATAKAKKKRHPKVYRTKIKQAKKEYTLYKQAIKDMITTSQKAFVGKSKIYTRTTQVEEQIRAQLFDFELLCERVIDSIHALGYSPYKPDPVFRGERQKSLNKKK